MGDHIFPSPRSGECILSVDTSNLKPRNLFKMPNWFGSTTALPKPLPKTETDLRDEATKLFSSLTPSLGLGKPTKDESRKNLIQKCVESHRIRRSFNHTSILLVGSSGVGKSSTINHLFSLENEKKIEFAKTSANESQTKDTQEYLM